MALTLLRLGILVLAPLRSLLLRITTIDTTLPLVAPHLEHSTLARGQEVVTAPAVHDAIAAITTVPILSKYGSLSSHPLSRHCSFSDSWSLGSGSVDS